MKTDFKPTGYNSASPYFVVAGAQKLIDLLKQLFETEELRRFERPDGSILHAEIRIEDSVVMLAEASEQYPPVPMIMHVYVPDVDQTYQKALAAGCEAIHPPKQQESDPDRRASFKDFGGNHWSVATQVSP